MNNTRLSAELMTGIEGFFQDGDVRNREFYPEFRTSWLALLEKSAADETEYFDISADACYTVHNEFGGIRCDFHIDQLKIAEWYIKEAKSHKHVVFFSKRLRRERRNGELKFHEAVCKFDPEAPERALTDDIRNIIAIALPCIPASMQIVYGNKWVESRFNVLRRHSLDIFLIGTDYVPAFLATPFEMCLYLFMMDCCIIKTNVGKMPDSEMHGYLHIFRPSPMLRLKGFA